MTALIDRIPPRAVAALTLLAAAFALGLALASEYWAGLLPCSLCLLERWPYRITIVLAAFAVVAPRRAIAPLLCLAALIMLTNTGLAMIHVGVEQRLWQNPIGECASPNLSGSLAGRLLQLSNRPPQPCDRASYLIPFLPLSMAAMNALYAAVLTAAIALYLLSSAAVSRTRHDTFQPPIMAGNQHRDRRDERPNRQAQQPDIGTAGCVLHEAIDRRTQPSAEIPDGVDHREAARCSNAGQHRARQ